MHGVDYVFFDVGGNNGNNMSNPKKIYISPSRDHGNDFSTEKGARYSVEYVRADLIAEKIKELKQIITSPHGDVQTLEFWSSIHDVIDELKKLIER